MTNFAATLPPRRPEASVIPSAPQLSPSSGAVSALFRPSSVAVVGASATTGKWGNLMVRHIRDGGYAGRLYPVNPRARDILGTPAYASLREAPEPIDLAIVGVSAASVPAALADCMAVGCRVVVVVTSGFGDRDRAGRRQERALATECRAAGVRLVGPNCLGVYSAPASLYASIALDVSTPGRIALVSQSGNVGVALFRDGARARLGFHSFVGLGNQADLGFHDLIEFLACDDECSVVALYVESLTDSARFFDAVARCSAAKPVVALKGGRNAAGARAARSHTGALATDGRIFDDLFRQAGGIPVRTMEELLTTALVLDRNPRRRTDRLAVLTDGGGFAVLAADEWEALGRRSATVTGPTVRALRGFLPSYCSVGNPTDVGGDSDSNPEVIGRAAATLLNDPGVGSLLLTGIVGGYGEAFNSEFVAHERRAVQAICSGWRHSGKPLLVHSLWELADSPVLAELADSGVAVVRSLQAGLRALAHLDGYARRVGAARQPRRIRRHPRLLVPEATDEASLYRFLGQAGLTVPNHVVIDDETAAPMAAARIGYPLVAKALVPGLAHKSELGAVRVGIGSSEELLRHVRELRELSDEVLLVQMLRSPVELLLGGLRSEQFGLLVSVGVGGLLAEAVAETVFLRAPLTKSEVVEALARSPVISRVLATQRRGRPVARGKLIRAVLCVADLMSSSPQIASLEINPLMLDEDHAWVADAKLRLASRGMGRADPG